MKRSCVVVALLAALAGTAQAGGSGDDWPTSIKTDSGYEFGAEGLYQYDINRFSDVHAVDADGRPLLPDASTWRRKFFGLYAKSPGGFEIKASYDFQYTWIDNYIQYSSPVWGSVKVGQFLTLVGWENSESSSALTLLERSPATNAIHESRRLGAAWTWDTLDDWRLSLGYFAGGNLDGDHKGHGPGARLVYSPLHSDDRAVHLGLSASREVPDDETAQFHSKPDAGLARTALVDTGVLKHVRAIDRSGLELGWMQGPVMAQGEYLRLDAQRDAGQGDFTAKGWYLQGAWMVTGESRKYKDGNFANTTPEHPWGAVELALRYSHLDLVDGTVDGGRQHDWTLGVNWYLGQHWKLQADYVRADARTSATLPLAERVLQPNVFEMRAQLYF